MGIHLQMAGHNGTDYFDIVWRVNTAGYNNLKVITLIQRGCDLILILISGSLICDDDDIMRIFHTQCFSKEYFTSQSNCVLRLKDALLDDKNSHVSSLMAHLQIAVSVQYLYGLRRYAKGIYFKR